MLTEERYEKIISELAKRSSVTVGELCEVLDTSESTVRRDLSALSKAGRLKKVHGGAIALKSEMMTGEPDVPEKKTLNSEEKDIIARYAAKMICKNDLVFIDAGTTTERMIAYITEREAVFVTNGFTHAHLLAMNGFKVYLTGGEVRASTQAIVGAGCLETIKNYNFTKCFLGTNGISIENGLTTPNVEEASVKRAVSGKSAETYILADHTKFNRTTPITFAYLEDVCIITDTLPDRKYKEMTDVKEACE